MRHILRAGLLVAVIASPALAQGVPQLPFQSVPDPLTLPDDIHFGEVAGVAVNSKGHIFVFSRGNSTGPAYMATAAQLLEFDANGKFVREVGKNMYAWSYAHAVKIDKDDNIWVVDKGSDMILKLNPQGRVVWVFGRKGEASHYQMPPDTAATLSGLLARAGVAVTPPANNNPRNPVPQHRDGYFNQPTDVAWDSGGNIYISDGYVNSRVAKYDRNGDWVMSWGEPGTGPGQFHLPHAIAIDRDDRVYVGDRTNRRIQVFDASGRFLRMFTIDVPPDPRTRAVNGNTPTGDRLAAAIGAPNSICIPPGSSQVMFVGESTYPGRIFKVSLDGKVLGVIGRSGRLLGQFSGAHGLACPSESEIYVAETSNWRVQKLVKK